MSIKRKDKGCEANVLAVKDGRVLLEARWPPSNRNIVEVSEEYFLEKYGRNASEVLNEND